LQLQKTNSFEKKHTQSELYNKLFNASHVSLVFGKGNSIETKSPVHCRLCTV